jgi:hypothetical protein
MMFKRILTAICLAFSLAFVAVPPQQAMARAYYIGQYSDGTDVYLLTNTVNMLSYSPYVFTCYVEYETTTLFYEFFTKGGRPYYRNAEGYEGFVYDGNSPVAASIYNYVIAHY